MARKQVIFWLDDSDPSQADLLSFLQDLKQKRAFAPTIRSALTLIANLQDKRVDQLEKQFPFVLNHYRQQPSIPPDTETQKRITLLEQAILQQNTAPSSLTARTAQLPPPKATEDLIEIRSAKEDQKSGWNALISMAALQDDFSSLPADVLAYGQQIGRIPTKPAISPKSRDSGVIKQLTGFKELAPPTFDDLDPGGNMNGR